MITLAVCSIPTRESLLSRLLFSLNNQVEQYPDQIRVVIADGWGLQSDKFNSIVADAPKGFIALIDDDDYLAPNYVEQVVKVVYGLDQMRYLLGGLDYVGYKILMTYDGKFHEITKETEANHKYYYSIKCLFNTDIMKQLKLGPKSSDDVILAHKAGAMSRGNYFIDDVLYHYDFWVNNSVYRNAVDTKQRDVGTYPFNRNNFTWINYEH